MTHSPRHLRKVPSKDFSDTLLPRLLSGELRVAVAEHAIAEGSADCIAMACFIAIRKGEAAIDRFLTTLHSGSTNYELDQYWLPIYERAMAEPTIRGLFRSYLNDTKLSLLGTHNVSFLKMPLLRDMSRKTAKQL